MFFKYANMIMKYIDRTDVTLTRRKMQILSMFCSGLSTDEICKKCGITYI
ncbi:MAG TPA: hypothetical protein DCG28_01130 [Lachnospiraceae bacterium]|nr:hypothetical protein [Lachnospiraceae bacterium]